MRRIPLPPRSAPIARHAELSRAPQSRTVPLLTPGAARAREVKSAASDEERLQFRRVQRRR